MRIIIFFSALLVFTACKKSVDSGNGNNQPASAMTDVSYGSDAKQKMDIYLPANRSTDSTKLIFLIHGGGWNEGDKADFTASVSYVQTLLPGYAIVNINYRLFANGQNLFPVQENDVKAAAEFVYNKRKEYLVSDKWVFLGASAGGHLALLQSYKNTSPVKPKAVVSFFGPSDLTSLYNSNNPLISLLLLNVTGTIPSLNPGLYQQSSPYNFITAQSPPTLLLHGGADPLVPPAQSTIVRDKLQLLGVPNQYVFYPTDGHGWTGPDLLDSFDKIAAFLKMYVH
ncbi:MAG: alpha/beta hydrolase [Chitinophagaceae bacterium]